MVPPTMTAAQSTEPTTTATNTVEPTTSLENGTGATANPSYSQRLNQGEQHWIWKMGLRALLVVAALIGLGAAAAVVGRRHNDDLYYYGDRTTIAFVAIIVFGVSVVWSLIVIFVLLLHKRPVHPGAIVGLDLLLWLAWIGVSIFTTAISIEYESIGANGYLSDYGSGDYELASNGTWIWEPYSSGSAGFDGTYYWSKYYARDCNDNSTSRYGSSYYYGQQSFSSCVEQDAYINSYMSGLGKRRSIMWLITVMGYLALVLHFALFVWACVDTHRRNRSEKEQVSDAKARVLAHNIVQDMISSGALIQPQQPPMAYRPGHTSVQWPLGPGVAGQPVQNGDHTVAGSPVSPISGVASSSAVGQQGQNEKAGGVIYR